MNGVALKKAYVDSGFLDSKISKSEVYIRSTGEPVIPPKFPIILDYSQTIASNIIRKLSGMQLSEKFGPMLPHPADLRLPRGGGFIATFCKKVEGSTTLAEAKA